MMDYIAAPTMGSLLKEANALGIRKSEVVDVVCTEGSYYMIYGDNGIC